MNKFYNFHPSLLREYDIRGIVNDTLSANDARTIGAIFGSIVRNNGGQGIVVGRDGRHSSLEMEKV